MMLIFMGAEWAIETIGDDASMKEFYISVEV